MKPSTSCARLSGDEGLWEACKRLWDGITRTKLYITGGIGATHVGEAFSYPFDLPNDTAYSETCAAFGLAFFARRMLQVHPKGEYGDVMEQALYNTVLAGMALDGKSFFYVNPLEADTLMPWEGETRIRIGAESPVQCTLAFRLPGYSGSGSLKGVRGGKELRLSWKGRELLDACEGCRITDGYLYLEGEWEDGDVLSLSLALEVHMWAADARVREDVGKVAFTRGPVTYCMEEADNGKDLHLCRADLERIGPGCKGVRVEMWEGLGHPMALLKVPGLREQDAGCAPDALYHDYAAPRLEETTLTLLPYYAWATAARGR